MKFFTKKLSIAAAVGMSLIGTTLPVYAWSYQAQDDDTFWSISQKFNVPLSTLIDQNSDIDPYNIYSGLTIQIPDQGGKSVTTDSGQTLAYKKMISGYATSYTAAPGENGSWGAVDYFGNPLKLGTVAVDPSVIPIGTKLYITGYNCPALPSGGMIAYARDTGGAIKGHHIDIFLPTGESVANDFGIQNVKIYLLKK